MVKTGDTMTGTLYIRNNSKISIGDTGMTLGTTASTDHYGPHLVFQDSGDNFIGYIRPYSLTNG